MSITGISYKNQECCALDCFNENLKSTQSIKSFYNDEKIKEKFIKSKMHSKTGIFVIVIFILGLSCAVAFLSYAYFSHMWSKHYCNTPLCRRSAQNLIAAMNTSIDPCEDFYKFACGNFAWYKPTPKYNIRSDWFDIGTDLMLKNISDYLERESRTDPLPIAQAKLLYRQCKAVEDRDDENFQSIANVLEEIGLQRLPPLKEASPKFSLLYTMAKSKLVYSKDFFISFSITMDPKNRTRYRLFLSKPTENPPLPVHYNHILLYNLKKRQTDEQDYSEESELRDADEIVYDGLPTEEDISQKTNSSDIDIYTETFYDYAYNVIRFAYNSTRQPWPQDINDTLRENIRQLINIDLIVDKLIITHFANDSAAPIPLRMKVDDLQRMTNKLWAENSSIPIINWKEYFRLLFSDVPEVKLNFDDKDLDAEIVIKDKFYISMMLAWLGETSPQELEMYMWWTTVSTLAPYTSSKLRSYADEFLQILNPVETRPRYLHCADVVNTIFGMVTAYSLVNNTDRKNNIEKVTDMVQNIQMTFKQSMKNIAWMDYKTKRATTEKLGNMKTCIGYPPWLNETDELEKYYMEYSLITFRSQSFLNNILELMRISSQSEKKIYRNKIDLEEEMWIFNPMDVNAYNWLEGNRITIPVGILQFPFYEHGLEVLNYAAIGSIIGHELTHGFDNTGKEYDATGEVNPWWTNETIIEFHNKVQCFIDHYENFHDSETSSSEEQGSDENDASLLKQLNSSQSAREMHLNKGKRTLDENIADNGGLRNALYAYRNYVLKNGPEPLLPELKQYSSEQLFFLEFANTWCKAINTDDSYSNSNDEHSPNHVRVWGTLTNSKEFAEAWKCEQGTPMNPGKSKCEMW